MKPQIKFAVAVLLIIGVLAVGLFSSSNRNQGSAQVLPATIDRDCAPWDGPAFTVSIAYEPESFINISIWQAPDIKLPARFSFPDETMRLGNVTFPSRYGYSEQLTGKVFFRSVDGERPVEGEFDLHTEAGQRFTGRFKAEWGNEIVMCG